MLKRAHLTILMAAGAFVLAGASVSGQTVITAGYTNLYGAYTASSPTMGTFSAVAAAGTDIQSAGAVTRVGSTGSGGGNAVFQPGFVQSSTNADVFISMTRNGNAGTGSYVFTADNNDDFRGDITGTWALVGTVSVFSGTATGVFSDPGAQFTGSPASTFFTQIPGTLNGSFIIMVDSGDFFGHNYNFTPTLVQASYVPGPGTLALLGLAGLVAGRRRRG